MHWLDVHLTALYVWLGVNMERILALNACFLTNFVVGVPEMDVQQVAVPILPEATSMPKLS